MEPTELVSIERWVIWRRFVLGRAAGSVGTEGLEDQREDDNKDAGEELRELVVGAVLEAAALTLLCGKRIGEGR